MRGYEKLRNKEEWAKFFDEHELKITEEDHIKIYDLKKPNTVTRRITFSIVKIDGGWKYLLVTGDYYRWSFCQSFDPAEHTADDPGYWLEKLNAMKCDNQGHGRVFSEEYTLKDIEHKRKDFLECRGLESHIDLEEDDMQTWSFWNDCYEIAKGRGGFLRDYLMEVRNSEHFPYDFEDIPGAEETSHQLIIVMAAFNEICRRLEKENE